MNPKQSNIPMVKDCTRTAYCKHPQVQDGMFAIKPFEVAKRRWSFHSYMVVG